VATWAGGSSVDQMRACDTHHRCYRAFALWCFVCVCVLSRVIYERLFQLNLCVLIVSRRYHSTSNFYGSFTFSSFNSVDISALQTRRRRFYKPNPPHHISSVVLTTTDSSTSFLTSGFVQGHTHSTSFFKDTCSRPLQVKTL